MSGDDEFSDSNRCGWIDEICDDFRLPFKRLCTKEFSLSNLINEESELYKKSIEIHRNKTLEAAIKVYQGLKYPSLYLHYVRSGAAPLVG